MIDRRTGGSPIAFSTARVGDRVGSYRIEELLGVGGTACVYRARAVEGHQVALKVLREDRQHDPQARLRFLREARVGALLHHPNIVRFADFGDERGLLYLAMEVIQGPSLWSFVESPPPASELLQTFDQILDALAHAHARSVVHRDLKPDNILLAATDSEHYSVRLVDFGVVQLQSETPSGGAQSVIGTPEYMSPEQCLGSPTVSIASDLYSVGVMLWECITGALPFHGKNPAATLLAHLRDPLPPFVPRPEFRSDASVELVLRRLLAREPSQRFPNAIAARRALASSQLEDREPALTPSALRGVSPPAPRVEPPPATVGLFLVSDPPFVDIRGELHELQFQLQKHIEAGGQGFFCGLSGDPGSGRSRFIHELAARLHEAGLAKVWSCDVTSNDSALSMLQRLLQRGYPAPIMHPDDFRVKLSSQLRSDGLSDDATLNAALQIFGESGDGTNSEHVMLTLCLRLIHATARRHPLILLLDNIDLNNGEIFDELPKLLTLEHGTQPLIVIATWRAGAEEHRPRFGARREAFEARGGKWIQQHRELRRLALRDMQRFLRRAITISPNAATLLADRADGNPSFAIELLRGIVTHHGDSVIDDPVLLDRALTSLPNEVGHLLADRINTLWEHDHLDASARDAVEMLTFLGTRFPASQALALLAELEHDTPQVLLARVLSTPALSSIISESNGEISFNDRLARAALMQRAEASGRATQWHRYCAEIKQRDRRNNDPDAVADIADHCIAAGLFTQARELYRNAAQAQVHANRQVEALRCIDRAIHTFEIDPEPDLSDLADTLIQRADLLSFLARFPEVQNTIATLDRLHSSDALQRSPQLLRVRALVDMHIQRDFDLATNNIRRAIHYAQKQNNGVEAVLSQIQLSWLLTHLGHLAQAELIIRDGLATTLPKEAEILHAMLLISLGFVAHYSGANHEAIAYLKHCTARFEETNNRRGLASCLLLEGLVKKALGEYQAAWDPLRRAQEEYLAAGDRRSAAFAAQDLGVIADFLGHSARARACFEQALATFRKLPEPPMIATCKIRLAAIDASEGNWRTAGEQLLSSLAFENKQELHEPVVANALVRAAREAILADRTALARDLLHRAQQRIARMPPGTMANEELGEIAHLLYQLDIN